MGPKTPPTDLSSLQKKIWAGSLPLEIKLAASECRTYDQSSPYLVQVPRVSYLPFLLSRLHAFFRSSLIDPAACAPHDGWFTHQGVPLKWHYPVGLLYDVYAGAEPAYPNGDGAKSEKQETEGEEGEGDGEGQSALPFRLTVRFTEFPDGQMVRLDEKGRVLEDAFVNAVKEADFLRYGTAKASMSLSKDDSTNLWKGVMTHNLPQFTSVNRRLLNPPASTLRNLPIRIYLPHQSTPRDPSTSTEEPDTPTGTLRVVQGLVPPMLSSRQPQTIGTALNTLLPALFPSRRSPLLAQPVLHGAVVPLAANAEEVVRWAAYADGWVHLGVVMMG